MSLLNNIATDNNLAEDKDSLGGGGLLETNVYDFEITMAYLTQSQNGAVALNLHLKSDEGRETRQQIYFTSGKAKGCRTYYEKDGEKRPLPGFTLAESLCLLTVGQGIVSVPTEEKTIKLYNFDAEAEVPTKVEVLMDLLGKRIKAGVFKQIVDKNAKGDDGVYRPTGETREENEIDKFFRDRDGMTVAEIKAEATEASFIEAWRTKWAGKTRDRASKAAGTAGAPKAAGAAPASRKPSQSLFV